MRVKLFLCFTLILFCGRLIAQDYIIKQDSTKLLGEVTKYTRYMVKIQPDGNSKSETYKADEIKMYHNSAQFVDFVSKKVSNVKRFIFLPMGTEGFENEYNYGKEEDLKVRVIASKKLTYYVFEWFQKDQHIQGYYKNGQYTPGMVIKPRKRWNAVSVYLENEENGLSEIPFTAIADRLSTMKLLVNYFKEDSSILKKINMDEVDISPEEIEKLVREYLGILEVSN